MMSKAEKTVPSSDGHFSLWTSDDEVWILSELSDARLRAKIVLSQTEDRDSDYFKSRFREHPVLEVRAVHPKNRSEFHRRNKQPPDLSRQGGRASRPTGWACRELSRKVGQPQLQRKRGVLLARVHKRVPSAQLPACPAQTG